jgi:hypothetical protein
VPGVWIYIPHHINDQFLSPHDDLFEDLLSTIFGDVVFGHHSIRLERSAANMNERLDTTCLGMDDDV